MFNNYREQFLYVYILQALFSRWEELRVEVRLDIWHFIRRLVRGCISESHPLYGTFMARLSACIYEWDASDYNLLMSAKRGELIKAGLSNPSPAAVKKALTKEEMASTVTGTPEGSKQWHELVDSLLLSLSTATDTLGVPLFRDEMKDIWQEQNIMSSACRIILKSSSTPSPTKSAKVE